MLRMQATVLILVSVLVIQFGCSIFEAPSQYECEAAVANVIELVSHQHAGTNHSIIEALTQRGTKIISKLTGDYQDSVKKCLATMNRHTARCVASCSSIEAMEKCW